MPWVAVFIGGLWIPALFYWGLNQFITQRTLGAKNLAEGQKGILFGASLKLLIPFIVVFPGMMAFELYGDQIVNADDAYPYFVKQVLPAGFVGVMFAALFGAVMSTLDSLLNSAATIFTMDIYKPYINRKSSTRNLVRIGRITTVGLAILGCTWAPIVGSFEKGIYMYLQLFWGFIQPGVVAAFLFGILWKKVPPKAAISGMFLNIPIYVLCLWLMPEVAFLHHMAITFLIISISMIVITKLHPLVEPVVIQQKYDIDTKLTNTVRVWSVLVLLATASLYIIFF